MSEILAVRVPEAPGFIYCKKFKLAIMRPLKLLFITPLVGLMALYMAVAYGILYLLIATFSFVYKDHYGFDEGELGLTFLPGGIGMMIGVVTFGALSDVFVKNRQNQGLDHKPEVRLSPALAMPCGIVLPIGLFIYGWTVQYGVHFIVPMLGVAIFSCGLMGVMVRNNPYLTHSEGTLTTNRCASKTTFWTRIPGTRRLLPQPWRYFDHLLPHSSPWLA